MKLFAQITKPNAGWPYDKNKVEALAESSEYGTEAFFEVDHINIGRSSTDVYLKATDVRYNSVNFTFYIHEDNAPREYDIFSNEFMIDCIQYTYINMLQG